MDRPQLTPLLSNATLSRLERLRILTRANRTERRRGEHLAGKGGASTEFCDYRDYAEGDDTRFVDWNIFARLRRPYLKQFHREEERHVVLLVDASASMAVEQKADRARQLAAAFGMVGLLNGERVSAYVSNGGARLPACRGRASLRRMFGFLESVQAAGPEPLEAAMESLLKHHRGRGVCVVASDFLSFGDIPRGLNRLYAAGLEVLGIQILAPTEIDPQIAGDFRLVDAETQGTLDVSSTAELLAIYDEHRRAHEAELASGCARRGGRFVSISSESSVESVLFDVLRRQGWLGYRGS